MPVEFGIIAPETAPAGSKTEMGWVGPGASEDSIQIGPAGARYLHYTCIRDGNPLRLRMPDAPGAYEFRYSFRDQEVIFPRRTRWPSRARKLMAGQWEMR